MKPDRDKKEWPGNVLWVATDSIAMQTFHLHMDHGDEHNEKADVEQGTCENVICSAASDLKG